MPGIQDTPSMRQAVALQRAVEAAYTRSTRTLYLREAFQRGWRNNAAGRPAENEWMNQPERAAFWKGWDAYANWAAGQDQ